MKLPTFPSLVTLLAIATLPASGDSGREDKKHRNKHASRHAHSTKRDADSDVAALQREREAVARERREVEALYERVMRELRGEKAEHASRLDELSRQNAKLQHALEEALKNRTHARLELDEAEARLKEYRAKLAERPKPNADAKAEFAKKLDQMNAVLAKAVEEADTAREELNGLRNLERKWKEEKDKVRRVLEERDAKIDVLTAALEAAKLKAKRAEDLANRARADLVAEQVARKKLEKTQTPPEPPPAIKPIQFTKSAAMAQREYKRVLEDVHEALTAYPKSKIHIVGHTCNSGASASNLRLSRERAGNLAIYLAAMGIPKEKITHEGVGESAPLNDNSTETLRAKNRRVEIWITN